MNRSLCHNCGNSNYLIVLKSGVTRCPICNCISGSKVLPIPTKIQSRVIAPAKVDLNASLSLLSAQLIAKYISKGMTTAEVATQLGITKATIYAKLRAHHLLRPAIKSDSIIHFTSADLHAAGVTRVNRFHKKTNVYRPSDRYCKRC